MDAAWGDAAPVDAPARGPEDAWAQRLDALEARLRALEARSSSPSEPGEPVVSAKLSERLGERVDALADRIDTLAETARAAASGLVARERELATLRREHGELKGTLDAAVSEFRRRVDPAPVDGIHRSLRGLSDRLDAVDAYREELAERLDALTDSADADRSTITSHARSLAELSSGVEASGVRMDSVVATVRQAVESLLAQVGTEGDAPSSSDPARGAHLASRLDALAQTVEALGASLESATAAASERERLLEARLDELAQRLEGLDARPRLVTWGSGAHGHDEAGPVAHDADSPEIDAPVDSFEGSELESDELRSETRGPIASFGGGT